MYLGLELVLELDPKYGRGQVSQSFRCAITRLVFHHVREDNRGIVWVKYTSPAQITPLK